MTEGAAHAAFFRKVVPLCKLQHAAFIDMELPGVPKTLPAWMLDHNTPPGIAAPPPRGRRFTEQGLLRALLFTPHDLVGRHASGAAMASAASAASVAPAAASPFLPMDVFSPPVAKAFALRHGASFPVDDSLGWLFESCPLRGCVTVVGGFVMGLVFGAAFSGAGMGVVGGVEAPPPPAARPAAAPGAPAPAAAAAAPPAPSGAVARVVQMQAEQAAVLMTPVNNLGGLPISPTIVTPRAGVASVAAMEAAETSALQAVSD